MRGASIKYRLRLPGFLLPDPVVASLQAYDECSAQVLENIADRMEGKTSQGTNVSADSFALVEQIQQSCRVEQSPLLLSEHGITFLPLLREIDRLTTRLSKEIATEE